MINFTEKEKEQALKEKEKDSTTTTVVVEAAAAPLRISPILIFDCARGMNIPKTVAAKWIRYMQEVDWKFKTGASVTKFNFRRSLRFFAIMEGRIDEEKKLREERKRRLAEIADRVNCMSNRRAFDQPGRDEVMRAAQKMNVSAAIAEAWLTYMENVDWRHKDGSYVTSANFRRSLRAWHEKEGQLVRNKAHSMTPQGLKEKAARDNLRRKEEMEKRRLKADIQDPASWILCEERCANYRGNCICAEGFSVPPQMRSWPVPPEQCSLFEEKL